MGTACRAAVLVAERTVELREIVVPDPGPDELLVRVLASGVCGSDLAVYRGTHPYKTPPVVLGHELCGEVVAAGDRCAFPVGERVCAAAFSPCDRCAACSRGAPHLCTDRRNLSHDGWDGSFAEYVLLHRNMVFALPGWTPPELGALVEPLSIAHHAVRLVDVRGRSVCVLGAGGIGLSCVLVARSLGAAAVTCVDLGVAKERLARMAGADGYVNAARDVPVAAADVTLVASGHPTALDEARRLTRPGGAVVVVSYFAGPAPVDLNALVAAELTVRFSALSTPADFTAVIGRVADGRLDAGPLITHRFPLAKAGRALQALDAGGSTGKVVLVGRADR